MGTLDKNAVDPDRGIDALHFILQGTAPLIGHEFFRALVKNLALALGTEAAWVTEYLHAERRLRSFAFWLRDHWVDHFEYALPGTPCEPVIDRNCVVHVADNVIELYPDDPDLAPLNAMSFLGAPLHDVDGSVLGHLAVLDDRPMPDTERAQSLLAIFAARASAELRRLRAEAQVREREEKLAGLVTGAMDSIVEFDAHWRVTLANPAAEGALGRPSRIVGTDLRDFLKPESRRRLTSSFSDLNRCQEGRRGLWITGGLEMQRADAQPFPAEATLSRVGAAGGTSYLLLFRNINDRIEAERRIASLTSEAAYLRDELRELEGEPEIRGRSEAIRELLQQIAQVAPTDATVLVIGETGTGKELVARALHRASQRRERPLIKVNCAAIPATLIESEFFGHERGAFTGATGRREGRFALADKGTLFLDEIGELPLELQSKLLRVLQEGEFEPVGGARTRKVDVRIVAATNRDLAQEVQAKRFREDLFYRLNVFPIRVPPLRERRDDIPLLAETFATHYAKRLGRQLAPLTPDCIRKLVSYTWPGNVRELQNVIERAVIIGSGDRLDLDRALPLNAPETTARSTERSSAGTSVSVTESAMPQVLTAEEIASLEYENILRALERSSWRIAGADGAAVLLKLKPSTLTSRMKALGIRKPLSA